MKQNSLKYWRAWEGRRNRIEKQWRKKIYKALQNQVRQFTRHLSRSEATHARQDIDKVVNGQEIGNILKALYIQAGLLGANTTYRAVKTIKFVGLGYNQEWTQAILDYFQLNLLSKAVLPITETTKKLILKIMSEGQEQGWSVEQTIRAIESQTDDINLKRARVIVRTESVRAMNYGSLLGAEKSNLVLEKRWITAHDERVRSSHRGLEGQMVDMDGIFPNGCAFPGDPSGGAKETINCRCTVAMVPKRDQNGRPIRKPVQRIPVYDRRVA